ncbi:rod shape-determining protein MreD [Winogradskyella aurantiaca]|uniref:rod shape-determining protein MreD n=1 Tax=Winogradskyella aurantiaca TaxID=2219558 RepID=UPI000E1DB5F2|nr:rod shape-determining protein MreD [Winogradskyella aurantiaca]
MSSQFLKFLLRFVGLVMIQVLICNHINFLGYINPYVYLVFILIYPSQNNRTNFLLAAFLLGLTVDIFSDSGGIHAAASVFAAFIRPGFLKMSFGSMYEHSAIKFGNAEMGSLLSYVALMVMSHHVVMFGLDFFQLAELLSILKNTLFSGVFTIVLSVIIILLFDSNK